MEGIIMSADQSGGHIRSSMGLEIRVRDVMTTHVLAISKYDSIVKVANILSEKNISGPSVVDKENKVTDNITQADILSMVGVSREHTFKDLLKYMLGDPLHARK